MPILTPAGHAVASVAISGPAERWTTRRAVAFAESLTEPCARLANLFESTLPPAADHR